MREVTTKWIQLYLEGSVMAEFYIYSANDRRDFLFSVESFKNGKISKVVLWLASDE